MEKLPRAALTRYNNDPKLSPSENFQKARASWDALSPELKGHLIILSDKEVQNFTDIRQGLLATLNDYQGSKSIKKLFEDAIKSVEIDN
jgi:hypothetical protein